jgi:hypothetical protein
MRRCRLKTIQPTFEPAKHRGKLSIAWNDFPSTTYHKSINVADMAKSRFEYVRNFELPDQLLQGTFIVVRVDGRGFHK